MFPFQFKQKQFPIRLSFAMTVNKSQGQTIPNVGVYLPKPVFSHGQLYVALLRATARSNIRIIAMPVAEKDANKEKGKGKGKGKKKATKDMFTKNIVYKEDTSNYSFSNLHASVARSQTPHLELENLLDHH